MSSFYLAKYYDSNEAFCFKLEIISLFDKKNLFLVNSGIGFESLKSHKKNPAAWQGLNCLVTEFPSLRKGQY